MNSRTLTALGVAATVLLLVIAAGVGAMLLTRPAVAQTSAGVPGMRQITVVGRGEITAVPDTATIQIGVETQAATSSEALAQSNAQAQALQQKLTELGVAAEDIQTGNFSISPVYDTDGRQITGYRVNNTVVVEIRNIANAGQLLDQVVQAGANNVYGISFSVDDPSALLDQARTQAMSNARARAELLAQAGNASVGQVLVISENIGAQPIPLPMATRAEDATASAVPVAPGEQTMSVEVQVTYQLQ